MHAVKINLFLGILTVSLSLIGCGTSGQVRNTELLYSEEVKLAKLDSTFLDFLRRSEAGESPDSLKHLLTDESLRWLENMEYAASNEERAQLEMRPFNEIMTIVVYRMFAREGRLGGIYKDKMLYLAMGHDGLLRKAMRLNLGPFEVKNDRGFRGLQSSFRVPILFFVWQDNLWKLDLIATMPVITRGIETIGVKKDWTPSKTVLYLLEKVYRNTLKQNPDETLLDPVRTP